MKHARKVLTVAVLLLATVIGLLRFTTLSNAANRGSTDECALFSCIFDSSGDDDD